MNDKKYPKYTRRISDLARIYIINNEIYKSRETEYDIEDMVSDNDINIILNTYDNVVVEKESIVHIYCKDKERIERYKQRIKSLEQMMKVGLKDKIIFNE